MCIEVCGGKLMSFPNPEYIWRPELGSKTAKLEAAGNVAMEKLLLLVMIYLYSGFAGKFNYCFSKSESDQMYA